MLITLDGSACHLYILRSVLSEDSVDTLSDMTRFYDAVIRMQDMVNYYLHSLLLPCQTRSSVGSVGSVLSLSSVVVSSANDFVRCLCLQRCRKQSSKITPPRAKES